MKNKVVVGGNISREGSVKIKKQNGRMLHKIKLCLEDESIWMEPQTSAAGGNADLQQTDYGYKKNFRTALPQLLAVCVKNLLLLSYGMTLGFSTILIPAVRNPLPDEPLHLKDAEISWTGSINLIVVPLGCAMSGALTIPLGRRRAMQLVNIPFFLAWIVFHLAETTYHLYFALFLTGLAGGLLEAPVLTYVAEITQPHLRGALSATSSLCIIIGVFTQFLFALFLYWRSVALLNACFTILAVSALSLIPESPYWLISKGRLDDAKKSLQWLRGWIEIQDVEDEFKDIQQLFILKSAEKDTIINRLKNFVQRSFVVPFFLVTFCFFIGHFSGMTTLQTYAVSIFKSVKTPIDANLAVLIVGILQIIGCAICVVLVHYTGKRPLAFFSTLGISLCCFGLAAFDSYKKSYLDQTMGQTLRIENSESVLNIYWVPTVLLMLLALLAHTGIRLLPWILIGEVFNTKTRSTGAGLASAAGYVFGFLTNKSYFNMLDELDISGTYALYGTISFAGCVVLYFVLPETEGKKLNEIENYFAGRKEANNEKIIKKKSKPVVDIVVVPGIDHWDGKYKLRFDEESK